VTAPVTGGWVSAKGGSGIGSKRGGTEGGAGGDCKDEFSQHFGSPLFPKPSTSCFSILDRPGGTLVILDAWPEPALSIGFSGDLSS
jgi:hypothetical protein